MGAEGLVWDHEKLDLFLENPKSLVSRTRMSFRGLKEPGDRADVIAFLRAYSDDPQNIPESAPTETRDPEVAPEVLALQGDPDYGEYLSGECVTCHRADGGDDGIPSITEPTRSPTRCFISRAALLVKVTARISLGRAVPVLSKCAIRVVSARVLPVPAPASTRTGPSKASTAAR